MIEAGATRLGTSGGVALVAGEKSAAGTRVGPDTEMTPRTEMAGPRVILASGSPRRRELLGNLGVAFQVVISGEDEDSPETDPARLAAELATLKARAVAALHPEAVMHRRRYGRRSGRAVARQTARRRREHGLSAPLSGRTHQVFTGVAAFMAAGRAARSDVPT